MNNDIERAIACAAAAGSLRFWSRQRPDCANGLTKAADRFTDRTRAHLDAWMKSPERQLRAFFMLMEEASNHQPSAPE